MRTTIWRRAIQVLFVALLATVAGLALPSETAQAANCVVTSPNDSGAGSLRAAIDQTDGYTGCATITFDLPNPSTITLTSGYLTINRNLTITGPGADKLTVSGDDKYQGFVIPNATVAISGLTAANGKSSGVAGAIYLGAGKLTLTDSVVRNSTAPNGGGGIKQDGGTLELTRVTVRDNTTQNQGGGIMSQNGTLTLTGSTISNNAANPYGGGIASQNGTLTLTDSIVSNNAARFVGGLFVLDSAATLKNCTIVGNGGSTAGGLAVVSASVGATATLTNCTVANNSSFGINTIETGGGGATTRLQNSIVAGNASSSFNYTNSTSLVSLGNNVSGDNSAFFYLRATGDLNNTNPLLAPLGNYGGPTQTLPLLPGSPAINRVPASGANCPAADQRGIPRPQGTACDSGAFESQGFTLAQSGGANQSATINTTFGSQLVATVTSANGEPVAGGVVTFTAPGSGASLATSPLTATIAANGTASATVAANGTAGGPYAVTASASGATGTASFSLTNTKLSQAITFLPDPLPARAIGAAPFTVTATATSALPVSFTAGPGEVCTVGGAQVTIVGVGTCTVTAIQPGNANYQAATPVARPFRVTEAATTTTVRGTATYGDTTATLTATVARTADGQPVPQGGTVTFTFAGATRTAKTNALGVASVTVSLPPTQAAGSFAGRVQASYAGAATALPSSDTGPLVVARRILWVTPADQTVGLRQPTPTTACTLELANGSAFINGDSWAAINLANLRCAYNRSGNGPATEKVGAQYRITAAGALSTNYDLRYQTGTLTVR